MSIIFKKFTPQDYSIVPFNAHKQYNFTSASAASNSVNHYKTQWASQSINLYSSASSTIYGLPSDTDNKVKYNQLDHLFYRNFRKISNNSTGNKFLGQDDLNYLKHKRVLYNNANILSIPTGLYGHEIKPNSVYFSSSLYEFKDDGYGNIIIYNDNTDNYITDIR